MEEEEEEEEVVVVEVMEETIEAPRTLNKC
jgi:hypothetical protein